MNPKFLIDHEPTPDPDRHVVRALLSVEGVMPDTEDRVPLNLSVVLDNSGSMTGEKIRHAKHAAERLLQRVFPEDVVSVVTFSTNVDVVAAAAPRGRHTSLSASIGRIVPLASTNLSGGWLEGRAQVERFRAEDRVNRILLMTDGLANAGITDPRQLASLFAQARATGVTTSTIGFGRDFDEHLLERLADAGGGNTHYIEHADQAEIVFRSELDELLALSAQNLTAELRLAVGVEVVAVHHSYPRETSDDGMKLQLGDLYASEPKQLLVELGAHAPGGEPTELLTVVLSGDVVTEDGGVERRQVTLPLSFSPADGPVVDPHVRRTLVFLEAAEARRRALEDERMNRPERAARTLRCMAEEVLSTAPDEQGREEAADLQLMAEMLDAGTFAVSERKYLSSRRYRASRSKGDISMLSRTRRREEEDGDGDGDGPKPWWKRQP